MTPDGLPLPGMIGRHPAMREIYSLVRRVAPSRLPVLVTGETGTGKELVARALHDLAGQVPRPFVDLNCAAVPESLAEGELFGWEKGAFTGAHQGRAGLLETAAGGTLFLDEACSLPLALQAKLLRVLEHRDFSRLGGGRRVGSDFRLVAAVSEPLPALLAAGRWRVDFAHRVSGVTITLPPLRHRGDDIRLLAEHFLRGAGDNGHSPAGLEPGAVELLRRHRWPGNVRELGMVMERVKALVRAPLVTAADLAPHLQLSAPVARDAGMLRALLQEHRWNVTRVARMLGMHRTTLHERIREFGLHRPPRARHASRATPGR